MTKRAHVNKSKIHGLGVIARIPFKRDQNIFILKGTPRFLKVKNKQDSALGPNWIGTGTGEWIDPAEPFVYLNHSCNPNMGIRGRVTFVALRDIQAGEELTFDYSTTEDDIHWEFKCGCGSKNCRKRLKSIQFLPKNTYMHYLPYIPLYFQGVYTKSHKSLK